MKSKRVNVRPGQALDIVAPCTTWVHWQAACSAGRALGFAMGVEIIIRAADTTGWPGEWKDGRPR